jgi:transposase
MVVRTLNPGKGGSMTQYIGMDAHMSTCSFCVMDESGSELDNITLPTNGRLIIDYLRNTAGTKKLAFEECELSNWLYEILKDEVDELIVCNPVANKEYKKKKTDKLDARQLAKLLRGNFLTPVFHDGSKRERFRGLLSGYQQLVNENIRIKNKYKSLFRRSGIKIEGEAVYKNRYLLEKITRPDYRFIGIQLHYLLERMNESIELYQQQIVYSKKHFKEIENLTTIPGIGSIQAAKIVSQVINPKRFPNKYKYFGYCGLVRHKKESGQRRYGTQKIWGNRTLKCVYKMAGHQAIKGTSALRKYYDYLRLKGVSDNNAYNAVCRKIAAISLSIWRNNTKYDDNIVSGSLIK